MTCHGTDVTGASSPPLTSSSSSRLRAAEPLTQPLRGDVTVTSPRRPWPAGPWRPRPQRRSRAVTMRGRRSSDDVTIAAGADVTAARRDVTVMAPAACWRRRSVSLMASSIGNVAASSTIVQRAIAPAVHSASPWRSVRLLPPTQRRRFHCGGGGRPPSFPRRTRIYTTHGEYSAAVFRSEFRHRRPRHTALPIYISLHLSAVAVPSRRSTRCSIVSRLQSLQPASASSTPVQAGPPPTVDTHTRARGRGPNGHTGVDTAAHWTGRRVGGGRQAQSIARAQQTRPINELTGGAGRHCSSSSMGRRQQETSSHDTAGGYTRTCSTAWQQRVQLNAIHKCRVYTACIRYTANTTQRSGVMHSALHPSGVA